MSQSEEPNSRLARQARAAGVPGDVLAAALEQGDPFAVLEWLIPRRAELAADRVAGLTEAAEALLREKVFAHPGAGGREVPPVVFGTGGHRGEIGHGLTLLHVHAIVAALIDLIAGMDAAQRAAHFGAGDLAEVRRRGFVLGHDNRLFNPEFSYYTAHLLSAAGYRVRYAGRITSPELSLLVPAMGWAGSLNFTPSHNPFRYGGLKFAPSDGGLAGGDLTDPLARRANRLLDEFTPGRWPAPEALETRIGEGEAAAERVDLHDAYLDRLNDHPVIRLAGLTETLRGLPSSESLFMVADPVWGAAVPVYLRLQQRLGPEVLSLIHTETDPYFGGQVTEPNESTLAEAIGALDQSGAAFKVAIRNDPDGDRGLVGDRGGACKMNRFAAAVMAYLMDIGQQGDLVTTHATSHLGPDFARARGCAVHLTPTGFKHFRPHLKDGEALLAYEESDGMTIRGHTLDKDGVLAGLIALRMVLHYQKPLSELVAAVEREVGRYHYLQETFMIDMSAAEAHQALKSLAAIAPGDTFGAGEEARTVAEVNGEDGYKFIFEGGDWVMMRPSGTEPKVRVYAESRMSAEATRRLCAAAKELALKAMAL